MTRVTPIFVLSLPRSGSTLLQRAIAAHPRVATASEPWLLLPLLLGFREGHVLASYRQRYLATAFEDFLDAMADGPEVHRRAIRDFALTHYEAACGPETSHFVDKTPRYHLVTHELLETFPDARFLLLWRNPLAVAASCVESWERGSFRLYRHRLDLEAGVEALVGTSRAHGDRLLTLRYEDLVEEPDAVLASVFRHCGLPPCDDAVERLGQVRLEGRLGDPVASSEERFFGSSARSWPGVFASPPRRAWARRYLQALGRRRLGEMGYDEAELLRQLYEAPVRWRSTPADLFWMTCGKMPWARHVATLRRRRLLERRGLAPKTPFE